MARTTVQAVVLGLALLSLAAGVAGAAHSDGPLLLDSGSLYWAGQPTAFDGSEVVEDVENASSAERTFRIRRVTADDEVGSLVREFIVGTNGERILELDDLEGRYVVRHDGQAVYVQNGTGFTESPPDGAAVTVGNSAWEVARQTVSASWSDDQVFRTQTADLRVESNRASFHLEVSARGLSFDDLVAMFDADDFADDHDVQADDDVLVLSSSGDDAFPVTFRELENGEYTLVLEVADTGVRTTARIQVGRPPDASTPTASPTATTAPTPTSTASPSPGASPTPSVEPPETTGRPTTTTPTGTPVETTASSPPVTTTTTPGQPGFGAGAALLALVVTTLVLHRRQG